MAEFTVAVWIQIVTNIAILIVGVTLVRTFSRMELKVETMWDVFMRNSGMNPSEHKERRT